MNLLSKSAAKRWMVSSTIVANSPVSSRSSATSATRGSCHGSGRLKAVDDTSTDMNEMRFKPISCAAWTMLGRSRKLCRWSTQRARDAPNRVMDLTAAVDGDDDLVTPLDHVGREHL